MFLEGSEISGSRAQLGVPGSAEAARSLVATPPRLGSGAKPASGVRSSSGYECGAVGRLWVLPDRCVAPPHVVLVVKNCKAEGVRTGTSAVQVRWKGSLTQ